MDLSLHSLRAANSELLPQFKNKHGGLAHSQRDGSDWNPAQWFQGLVGEIGEYADARLQYECGGLSPEAFAVEAAKELADVQIYLDIVARRALDTVPRVAEAEQADAAQRLMVVMSCLGAYANARKKLDRGDMSLADFESLSVTPLNDAIHAITMLMVNGPANAVVEAHATGVDLARAAVEKFNEVSVRVGGTVRLREHLVVGQALPFCLFKAGDLVRFNGPRLVLMMVYAVDERGDEPMYTGVDDSGRTLTVPDSWCSPSTTEDQLAWSIAHPKCLAGPAVQAL